MPEAAYYVFLKITFGLPKKLVGTCNFRVTSSHANCERRKADVRGFAEPWLSPFRLSSNLCSHRCRVCRQPEQAPGLAAPFQRVGSPSGTGKREGKEKKETELQTETWEVISAMPWWMGNWVSVVLGKTRVGQWRGSGSPAGAGGRLQNNPSFYVFSKSWSNGCKRSVCSCPCSPVSYWKYLLHILILCA